MSDDKREDKPWRKRDAPAGRAPSPGKPRERGKAPDRFAEDVPPARGERIAKRLARAGIASRRDAELLIEAGRVRVNGKVLASPAFNVDRDDVIELDGELLAATERTRVFLFNKPAGVVTTNRDPEGRRTVFDVLPQGLPRLITVGRLDITTEGLLLLTNDGGLARVLELPATGWLRRYRARVHGKVDEARLAELKDGIAVDGVFYGSIEASLDREQGSNAWLTIGLREGKNREVKNILGALGLEVARLIRVSFGPFQLGELPEGHVLELKGRVLRDQLGERLIEESGADFESDIVTPFSNRPTARVDERPPAEIRERPALRVGEGGLVKRRHARDPREEALGRLQTSRPMSPRPKRDGDKRFAEKRSGDKPAGDKPFRRSGKEPREGKPLEPPGGRLSNVWMAPGARPPRSEAAQPVSQARIGRADATKPFRKPRNPESDASVRDTRPHRHGQVERINRTSRARHVDVAATPQSEQRDQGEKSRRPFAPRGDKAGFAGKSARQPLGQNKSFAARRKSDINGSEQAQHAKPENAERSRRFGKAEYGTKPLADAQSRGYRQASGTKPDFKEKLGFKSKPKSGAPRDRPDGGGKPRPRGKPNADRRR